MVRCGPICGPNQQELAPILKSHEASVHQKEPLFSPSGGELGGNGWALRDSRRTATHGGFSGLLGVDEAECEALVKNAALRDVVRLWDTLGSSVQHAVVAIVHPATRE